jgi:hypothetical protein
VLYYLRHAFNPFCSGYFGDRVSLFAQASQDHDPLPLLGWARVTMPRFFSTEIESHEFFFPRLAWKCDPSNLSLPNSQYYKSESTVPGPYPFLKLCKCVLIVQRDFIVRWHFFLNWKCMARTNAVIPNTVSITAVISTEMWGTSLMIICGQCLCSKKANKVFMLLWTSSNCLLGHPKINTLRTTGLKFVHFLLVLYSKQGQKKHISASLLHKWL